MCYTVPMFTKMVVTKYMNTQAYDILNTLKHMPYSSQRALAQASGHSLGMVNRCVKDLTQAGYLDSWGALTEQAQELFSRCRPQNAVILAAGFGMRMVPINLETPKALLEVNGQRLIERTILQLQEAGIREIYVVVGFMKEQFEYLIDQFGVTLVVNSQYAGKNNLHSLALVGEKLGNSFIVPCDLWCQENPFCANTLYSWYMVSDRIVPESTVRVNRKMELVTVTRFSGGNEMLGICYLLREDAERIRKNLTQLCQDGRNDGLFWEETLYEGSRMTVWARVAASDAVVEINTYEQLRELDGDSNHLKSDAIGAIMQALKVQNPEIVDITVLKKGMTNRSFLFTCRQKKYIMRIPGEGTDRMINRRQEAAVYQKISNQQLCDTVVYLNPENGYKITEYLENARVCNPNSLSDLKKAMQLLRRFHESRCQVEHCFDLFGQIDFYQSLWNGTGSVYRDYDNTKKNVLSLKPYIESHISQWTLTHIDAVPDNFLFVSDGNGEERVVLIDWEYAGMQDPHVDIAMFCLYAMYDREETDRLIDLYFENQCPEEIRTKIYCYMAVCGLLWSNWCEYKRNLGVEFGAYSLKQYRYAKEYYKLAAERMKAHADNADQHS